MKLNWRYLLLFVAFCLVLSAGSFAADANSATASLYFVHGIPGRILSENVNPGLPVDVLLNDEVCYLRGLTFTGSSGPLTFPAGDYDVKISPSNSLAPCSNAPITETSVNLPAGSTVTLALSLSNGTPALLSFAENLRAVPVGMGRVSIANASDAGTLDLTLTQQGGSQAKTYKYTIKPGAQITVQLPIAVYTLQATSSGTSAPFASIVAVENQAVSLFDFVGSATNNSVAVVSRIVRFVF